MTLALSLGRLGPRSVGPHEDPDELPLASGEGASCQIQLEGQPGLWSAARALITLLFKPKCETILFRRFVNHILGICRYSSIKCHSAPYLVLSVNLPFWPRKLSRGHFYFLQLWVDCILMTFSVTVGIVFSIPSHGLIACWCMGARELGWVRVRRWCVALSVHNGCWRSCRVFFRSSWNSVCIAVEFFPLGWIPNSFIFNRGRGCVPPGGFSRCTVKM